MKKVIFTICLLAGLGLISCDNTAKEKSKAIEVAKEKADEVMKAEIEKIESVNSELETIETELETAAEELDDALNNLEIE